MKKKLRLISAVIILSMIFPILSGIVQPVFAVDNPLNIYTNEYDKSTKTLKIRWDAYALANVKSCTIIYHVPDSTGDASKVEIFGSLDSPNSQIDLASNSATINNVKNDIIYDFEIKLEDNSGETYIGKRYFLAQISVFAEQVDQQPVDVTGGGVETGVYPAIKLSWIMPKIFVPNTFDPSTGTIEYANGTNTYGTRALAQLDESIEKMNFTFNIASQKSIANVKVVRDPDIHDDFAYKATVSGDITRSSDVKWDSNTGKLSIYILGVKDNKALIPLMDDIRANTVDPVTGLATLPNGIPDSESLFVLPHQEILPGSIYKISMNTLLFNSSDVYVDVDSFTNYMIDTPLMGALDYTYTPIRFQLTKDASENIYVGIHRVNSGDLNMPNLFYEVQSSNVQTNQDSSWTTRKILMDRNFQGEYAITGITGINSKNTVYYRVIVKSDGASDRIQSLKLPYTMQDDTARPPVPNRISITDVDLVLPPAGIEDTSSDITISWDKPSNWDQIKGHLEKDIYYHFLINVSEKDLELNPIPTLESNGKPYGQFAAKYRLVKYVSANSNNIKVSSDGSKLIYTLKGYELFTWENENGTSVDSFGNTQTIPNPDSYPTYLLPNKTYYLQMYTTLYDDKGELTDSSKMSEKSLTTSFTTLSTGGREVSTPKYLEWVKTTINPSTPAKPAIDAAVEIRFDAPKIDWSNYTSNPDTTYPDNEVIYDLYMSTSTEPTDFHMIGTTQSKLPEGDVSFTMSVLDDTIWYTATINTFTGNNNNLFGNALAPNTTYYFMVKVRLKIVDEYKVEELPQKKSIGTILLPVTTPRGEATIPDDTEEKPVAPTDFSIALDKNGDAMIDGQSVTFEWTAKENAAAYNLIATSKKVNSDTPAADNSILNDATYKSFISFFGGMDNDGNANKLTLDPKKNILAENFSYDSTTKKCRYTINTWLYPNKIYYFSLKAEIVNAADTTKLKTSVWVSIPVTTALIESPTKLQVVNDCELAFNWLDSMPQMTSENYSISLKASGDSDYTLLAKSQYKIVKDDSVYYARTTPAAKLKPNTQYSIRVERKSTTGNYQFDSIVKYTRDDYYQIDVKWQGYKIDANSKFEIAIKTEADSDYTVLDNRVDLEWYVNIAGQEYPYYIEKDYNNLDNNYYIFNARIKLAPIKLPDGTVDNKPLIPNTKYYIKVRAVKTDSTNSVAVTPSKYAGPVETRTEFNQDDYDNTDNNTSISAKFLDMLDKLEQDIVWEVSKQNGVTNKILVKDEKIINLLEAVGNYSFTIDMSQSQSYINSDEIYFAKDILKAMKSNDRSIIIKTKNAEYTVRPDTFNPDDMEEFKKAKAVIGSKDVYLKINNIQSTSIEPNAPANTTPSSKMSVLSAQAVVSKQTSASINALIKDKLYNEKTGIIQKKLAIIKNPNNLNVKKAAEEVDKYLNGLYEEVKSELSFYLEDTLNGVGYTTGILTEKYNISKFYSPLGVKMPYKASSISNPYVLYGNVGKWQKLTQNLKYENSYLSYFVTSTGKYVIFSSKDVAASVADESAAKPYISKLAASYDLTTVFPGADVSFNSGLKVTVSEGILLYELLLESQNDSQTDVKTKAKAYGIDKIINITNVNRNLNRQEAAGIIIKLYCQKTGADYDKLKASYSRVIKDDSIIDERYSIPVYICLQMNVMTLDSSTNFNPKATINRAEIATVLQKMLEV